LRGVLRSRPLVWAAPRLPRSLALGIARRLRRASTRAVAAKPVYAKEQQESEVRRLAELHACATVVCGHAHVFRNLALEGGLRWLVLGAFGDANDVLRVSATGGLNVASSPPSTHPTP
jgi:UDP-2,3-diacylglucosamine pyrophosphatase LpxH